MAGINKIRDLSENELLEFVRTSNSKSEVLQRLEISPRNSCALKYLTDFIKKENIEVSHFKFGYSAIKKYGKNMVSHIVSKSDSLRDVLLGLGLSDRGGNYRSIQKLLDYYGIDTSHFTRKASKGQNTKTDSEVFKEGSEVSQSTLRSRFRKKVQHECSECGIISWNGKKIVLQIDHVNGIHNDNRLENLRLLCPNCHSQTSTFGRKNS